MLSSFLSSSSAIAYSLTPPCVAVGTIAIIIDLIRFRVISLLVGAAFGPYIRIRSGPRGAGGIFSIDPRSRFWRFYNYYVSYFLYGIGIFGFSNLIGQLFWSSTTTTSFFSSYSSIVLQTVIMSLFNGLFGLSCGIYIIGADYEQSGPGAAVGAMMSCGLNLVVPVVVAGVGSLLTTTADERGFSFVASVSSSSGENEETSSSMGVVHLVQMSVSPIVMLCVLFGRATSSD